LLVEDTASLRAAFGRLLRLNGFEVCEATNGRQALDRIGAFHPRFVLTDLMMPVMDGFELIRALQAEPSTAGLPVVAITANATAEAEQEARDAGALAVIHKPIDLPGLLSHLQQLQVV
jgi:CheY-like chemotaxis protein